jgi:regulator of replication initiation timing
LHKNALDSYVKVDKEVKSLQFLTTSLEQERNELLEKNKQLEVKNKELETKLEESKEEVQIEREEAEKALKTASI